MARVNISEKEKAFADLILAGWKASQAYLLLFQTKASGGSISVIASRLKNSPNVKSYLERKAYRNINNFLFNRSRNILNEL